MWWRAGTRLPGAPSGDGDVFELLAAAVFQARFRPAIVRARWPQMRRAFAQFDLATVAAWPDESVDVLLQAEGMIRNPKKIKATLRNARDLQVRSRAHGGALAYASSFDDQATLVRDIDTWAHCIGAPSIRWLVQALGCRESVRRGTGTGENA